jgi:hypothetical protein
MVEIAIKVGNRFLLSLSEGRMPSLIAGTEVMMFHGILLHSTCGSTTLVL